MIVLKTKLLINYVLLMKYKLSTNYAAVILVLLVLLTSCSRDSHTENTVEPKIYQAELTPEIALVPTDTSVLSIEDIHLSDKELDELKQRLIRSIGAESFRYVLQANITTDVAGIQVDVPIEISGEFEPPDKSKSTASINMGFISTSISIVTAEGQLFFTDSSSGKWTTSKDTRQIFSSPNTLLLDVLEASQTIDSISREKFSNRSLLHLQITNVESIFGNTDQDIEVDIWVNEDDLRIYKFSIDGPIYIPDIQRYLPSQIAAGSARISGIYEFFGFSDPVHVEIPKIDNFLVDGRLPGRKVFEQVNLVIDFGVSHPEYKSTPATSGWHYGHPDAPATWGVHDEFIPDEILIQNLVQGGIGLHYNCSEGCTEIIDAFVEISRRYPKIIVSPYEGMEKTIAITSWSYIDEMDDLDVERIELFIKAHHNSERAPEYFKP